MILFNKNKKFVANILLIALLQTSFLFAKDNASPTVGFAYSSRFFLNVNEKDAIAAMQVMTGDFLDDYQINLPNKMFVFNGAPDLLQLIRQNDLDFLVMQAHEFVQISEILLKDYAPILVSEVGESVYDEYLIVVHTESKIDSISDLKGKSLVIQFEKDNSIELIWLETELQDSNLCGADRFLSNIRVAKNGLQTVLPIFFKQADACIVLKRQFKIIADLNPQLGIDLKIIKHSPGLLRDIVLIKRDMHPKKPRKLLMQAVANIHNSPRGVHIVNMFGVDGLVDYEPGFIKELDKLIIKHKQLVLNNERGQAQVRR